jgi:hypothetical protein
MRIRLEDPANNGTVSTMYLTTERIYPNTLEALILQLGGSVAPTKAQITRIVVKLGGSSKPAWDITGPQLESICKYEGRPSTATVLVLPFSNTRARTIESQMIGALDFGAVGIRKITVEITVSGGTAPTITAWAEVAPPKLFGPDAPENKLFRAIITTPLVFSGAGTRLPKDVATAAQGGALLRRLYFFGSEIGAGSGSFEHRRDGQAYFEDTPFAVNNAYLDELGHDPQTNIYVYDAIDDDNESKALAQVRGDAGGLSLIPQQFIFTVGGAQNIPALADVFTNINGL